MIDNEIALKTALTDNIHRIIVMDITASQVDIKLDPVALQTVLLDSGFELKSKAKGSNVLPCTYIKIE